MCKKISILCLCLYYIDILKNIQVIIAEKINVKNELKDKFLCFAELLAEY